jgi:hypothetical protein
VTKEDPQEEQDTRESEALDHGQVSFEPEEVEAVGDPAAASVEADPGAAEAEVAAPAPAFEPPTSEPPGFGGQSPIEADRLGAARAADPPIGAIVGAFAGAFVAAKLLGRLGGGDD